MEKTGFPFYVWKNQIRIYLCCTYRTEPSYNFLFESWLNLIKKLQWQWTFILCIVCHLWNSELLVNVITARMNVTITIAITNYVICIGRSSQRIIMSIEFNRTGTSISFPYTITTKTLVSIRSIPDTSVVQFQYRESIRQKLIIIFDKQKIRWIWEKITIHLKRRINRIFFIQIFLIDFYCSSTQIRFDFSSLWSNIHIKLLRI